VLPALALLETQSKLPQGNSWPMLIFMGKYVFSFAIPMVMVSSHFLVENVISDGTSHTECHIFIEICLAKIEGPSVKL